MPAGMLNQLFNHEYFILLNHGLCDTTYTVRSPILCWLLKYVNV